MNAEHNHMNNKLRENTQNTTNLLSMSQSYGISGQVKPKAVKRILREVLGAYEKKYRIEKICSLLIADVCNKVMDDMIVRSLCCMKHAKRTKLTVSDVLLPYQLAVRPTAATAAACVATE